MLIPLFKRWCWAGVKNVELSEIGPYKLVNTLSFLVFSGLLLHIPLVVALSVAPPIPAVLFIILTCVVMPLVPLLSARQYPGLARNLLLSSYTLYIVFASQVWPSELNLYQFLLVAVIVCPFVFPNSDKRAAKAWTLCLFAAFLCLQQHAYWQLPPALYGERLLQSVNQAVLGFSVLLCSFYLHFNQRAGFRKVNNNLHLTQKNLDLVFPKGILANFTSPLTNTPTKHIEHASVLFADMSGFTQFCHHKTESQVAAFLEEVYSVFDQICTRLGVDKVKTNGDEYMAVAGVQNNGLGPQRCCVLAMSMHTAFQSVCAQYGAEMTLRIGISTGPVVAGILGTHRFQFDVWGHTVNLAARLEHHCERGGIRICSATAGAVTPFFSLCPCSEAIFAGLGLVKSYQLHMKAPRLLITRE